MDGVTKNQKVSAQYLLDTIYDVNMNNNKILLPTDLLTEENYLKNLKLLHKIPVIMIPCFESLVTNLLKDSKNIYRIVWLGTYLKHIYQGHQLKACIPESWEDEADLYYACQKFIGS